MTREPVRTWNAPRREVEALERSRAATRAETISGVLNGIAVAAICWFANRTVWIGTEADTLAEPLPVTCGDGPSAG